MDLEGDVLTQYGNLFHSSAPIALKFLLAKDVYRGMVKLASLDLVE